jgi:hypothetical protein
MTDPFNPRSSRLPARLPRSYRRPRVIDLFDPDTFGPQPGDRQLSGIRRHLEWIGQHEWPARIVIVVGEITLAYLCLVFGMLVGAGFMGG